MNKALDWLPSIVAVVIAATSFFIKLLESDFQLDRELIRISLLSAALALLVVLLDLKLNALRSALEDKLSSLEKDVTKLRREHRDTIYEEIEQIKPAYLSEVVHRVASNERNTLSSVVNKIVNAAKDIYEEEDYLKRLRDRVHELRLRDAQHLIIHAACGQKTWGIPVINDYWNENIKAAEAGATIVRIFVEVDGGLPKIVYEGGKQQKAAGIEVRTISEEVRRTIRGIPLPTDIGFVIISMPDQKET